MLKIQNSLRTLTAGDYLYERLVDLGLIKSNFKIHLSVKDIRCELNVFYFILLKFKFHEFEVIRT
jgi:hypothetical protein